jgi:hypothetical protein
VPQGQGLGGTGGDGVDNPALGHQGQWIGKSGASRLGELLDLVGNELQFLASHLDSAPNAVVTPPATPLESPHPKENLKVLPIETQAPRVQEDSVPDFSLLKGGAPGQSQESGCGDLCLPTFIPHSDPGEIAVARGNGEHLDPDTVPIGTDANRADGKISAADFAKGDGTQTLQQLASQPGAELIFQGIARQPEVSEAKAQVVERCEAGLQTVSLSRGLRGEEKLSLGLDLEGNVALGHPQAPVKLTSHPEIDGKAVAAGIPLVDVQPP